MVAKPISQAEIRRYTGTCDASAAVSLGDYFLVAEDENNALLLYRHGVPDIAARIDLKDYLAEGEEGEADLEGGAYLGDRIYWISSHGRNKKGKQQPARLRFFATEVSLDGNLPAVKPQSSPPYKNLLTDLIKDPVLKPLDLASAAAKAPDDPDGLNIEGLAATPAGLLLIGFRNPRPMEKAIIVPLVNPAEVTRGVAASFGEPILLDLDGRGIRSIEWIRGRYIIVAGHFDAEPDFALYQWSGDAHHAPTLIEHGLGGLNPEAVFEIHGTSDIEILSDDGEEKINGRKCKDEATPAHEKSFRSLRMTLP